MPDPTEEQVELRRVIDRVRALFHRLKAAAARVHGEGERSAARRGVLLGLHSNGAQTVPQMAAARPVSRQFIQTVVNSLLADGLVEKTANPNHRRSHLIRLTDLGRARVRAVLSREAAIFAELDLQVTHNQLRQAVSTLDAVHSAFEPDVVDEATRRVDGRS